MTTASYLAGAESNAVELSYGAEATWGTAPAVAFNAIRATGESLSGKKSRARPSELRTDAQETQAVTQQIEAGGDINFAFSYGTYDDFLVSLFNSAWTADLAIVAVSGDISTVASGNHVTSSTSSKFTNIVVGQWIKLSGFSTSGNNGWARVSVKTSAQDITVTGITLADETPSGTAAHIKGSMLRNSNTFNSLFIQKKLAASQYLTYGGCQITAMDLNVAQGSFTSGKFSLLSQVEAKSTSDSSTGSVVAAPTGRVIDTVADFKLLLLDGSAVTAHAKSIVLNVKKNGAAMDYALGSASAVGTRMGLFELAGTFEVYFSDFTFYDRFVSEAAGALSFELVDFAGSSYIITAPYSTIMNPGIVAGGVNQPVMAKFALEGNPDPVTGCTLQIDRVA